MDTRFTTHSLSSMRSFGMAGAVLFLWGAFSILGAQQPPAIRAKGFPLHLVVIDPTKPLVFPEQPWTLVAPNPFGPTITVWSLEPFQSLSDPKLRVDAALDLSIRGRSRKSDWDIIIPHDRTSFAHGRTTAEVVAGSIGGNGEAGITVTFLGHEQPFLAAGEYEATVIGTISEGF